MINKSKTGIYGSIVPGISNATELFKNIFRRKIYVFTRHKKNDCLKNRIS